MKLTVTGVHIVVYIKIATMLKKEEKHQKETGKVIANTNGNNMLTTFMSSTYLFKKSTILFQSKLLFYIRYSL